MNKPLKIVITGPESTGKSWLSEKLATHFNFPVVFEFARKHLEQNEGKYDFPALYWMAEKQIEEQSKVYASAERPCIFDTDTLTYKIWSAYEFKKTDPRLIKLLKDNPGDIYLLCNPDIPFEPDPLRLGDHVREPLFKIYEAELKKLNRPYYIIKGQSQERLNQAIRIIQEKILTKP